MKHLLRGSAVQFVDPKGISHNALVTNIWESMKGSGEYPGVNLVLVSADENKEDTYGRQTERFSSVVHESNQPAHGNFWKFID